MNRETYLNVFRICAASLLCVLAVLAILIFTAKILDVVGLVEPSKVLEAAGVVDAPARPDPERWKASVFSQVDKLLADRLLNFDGDGDLQVNGGPDFEDSRDIVFGTGLEPLMAYDGTLKRWALSDRFLEDVADALVPVLKERGFLTMDKSNEFQWNPLFLETSP